MRQRTSAACPGDEACWIPDIQAVRLAETRSARTPPAVECAGKSQTVHLAGSNVAVLRQIRKNALQNRRERLSIHGEHFHARLHPVIGCLIQHHEGPPRLELQRKRKLFRRREHRANLVAFIVSEPGVSVLDRGDNGRKHVAETQDGHRTGELGFRVGERCVHVPLRRVAVEGRVRFFESLSKEREVGL